jgi:hypothetical protein
MKITSLFLMVLFFTPPLAGVVPVFAQDQPPSEEHQPPSAEDIIAKMQSKLNLTQDQVNAITPIIEKYSSKREALRQSMEDGTADRDTIGSQMKQSKTDEKQELSQVLSADQMNQFEQMMNRHRHTSEGGDTGPVEGGDNGGEG